MNIPESVIEPFGYTGMPVVQPRVFWVRAKRLLEVCEERANRWLEMYVISARNPNWTDGQIRKYLTAELLHEKDWLSVTVSFHYDLICVDLRHHDFAIIRKFSVRR